LSLPEGEVNGKVKVLIKLRVNGQPREVAAFPMQRLLDVIREEFRLTGTKEGCGEGECGACSVFLDGQLVNSCLVPAMQAAGTELQTVEGLARPDHLHAMQEAFIACGGAQCGICTPGMLIAAIDLLRRSAQPTDAEMRDALAGNICRCTGYMRIFESVVQAARSARRVGA
jgi:carbon-monoxide dehydrogenase small subunit